MVGACVIDTAVALPCPGSASKKYSILVMFCAGKTHQAQLPKKKKIIRFIAGETNQLLDFTVMVTFKGVSLSPVPELTMLTTEGMAGIPETTYGVAPP